MPNVEEPHPRCGLDLGGEQVRSEAARYPALAELLEQPELAPED